MMITPTPTINAATILERYAYQNCWNKAGVRPLLTMCPSYPGFSLAYKAYSAYQDHGLMTLISRGAKFAPNKIITRLVQQRSLSRTELRSLTDENGEIWRLEKEDPISIPPLRTADRDLFSPYPKEFQPDQPFVCELEDCHLVGPTAVSFSKNNKLVIESIRTGNFDLDVLKAPGEPSVRSSVLISFLRRLLDIKTANKEYYEEDYVFPLISPDESYYHWVVEYLPKLRLLEHYEYETGNNPTVLIESDPRSFVQESIELAGYDSTRYREWDEVEQRVKHLVLPLHRLQMFNSYIPAQSEYHPSRDDLDWLRARMRSNIRTDEPRDSQKKIYVSRQNVAPQQGRKVKNYDELKELLHSRGFASYVLEELSFEKQVKLFSEADVIMGPHGAGLTNLLFASDPLVVELFPDNKQDPYFYYISHMFEFDYEPVISSRSGRNIFVNISDIETLLDNAGV